MRVTVGVTVAPPTMTWPRVALLRAWAIVAAVGFAFLVAHSPSASVGRGSTTSRSAGSTTASSCSPRPAASCGPRRSANERWIWAVLGLGILSFSLGDICFDFVYGGNPPSPSVCDAFYLAFYPACYAALALLIRSRISHFDRERLARRGDRGVRRHLGERVDRAPGRPEQHHAVAPRR